MHKAHRKCICSLAVAGLAALAVLVLTPTASQAADRMVLGEYFTSLT